MNELGQSRENLEKARAMKCFGSLVEVVVLDPDPNVQDALMGENNCKNCEGYQYCCVLANTLSNEVNKRR